MFTLSVGMTLLSVGLIFLHVLTIAFFFRPMVAGSRAVRLCDQHLHNMTYEYMLGIREIRSFGMTEKVQECFEQKMEERVHCVRKINYLSRSSTAVCGFIGNFWSIAILWYGGLKVLNGEFTLGSLMAFSMVAGRAFHPVSDLTNMFMRLKDDLVGIRRIFEILKVPREDVEDRGKKSISHIDGKIDFESVWFSYDGESQVLKGATFSVAPKEVVALIGKNGSGKTTVCNLICGFYQPSAGSVSIDDFNLSSVRLNSLRESIGIVPQQPFLFSGTIRDNLICGKGYVTDDELDQVMCDVNMADMISRLPNGLQTQVGEKGIKLSSGERQRIAIARALLKKPSILILDEPMAFLDAESEKTVGSTLEKITRRQTTIIIAHSMNTIRKANKVLVVDSGQVIEKKFGPGDSIALEDNFLHTSTFHS